MSGRRIAFCNGTILAKKTIYQFIINYSILVIYFIFGIEILINIHNNI